ncbi:DUF1133 family protein [Buttiauxella selenatireducens]|uniref:DUF1133 family protein n=1 Tax=Buttiauxella selenatireducens TaxID=3073902 RepID=A0ABY9SD29_9ENTR|nr:DUF1133 family protein [Buttiauxella sp. R73]WMY75400.1 DUF1133 family protein [Buttiauxella sp. R73]
MINATATGKSGEMVRLHTLESVWIQGKLRMWGRWSFIGGGSGGNMFNQLLATKTLTKTAINEALRRMKKSGITKPELEEFLKDILNGKHKSNLAFCTDEEALKIDGVIGAVLKSQGYGHLVGYLNDRYQRRMSKKAMARDLHYKHPEWCLRTCETRIDVWLNLAESMLYAPMCDVFDTNSTRFSLHRCAETV